MAEGAKKPPVEIGDRLQMFVDSYLTDTFAGASLALHSPLPREIAFHFDEPWEGPTSAYVAIIKDGDLYRAYYRGSGHEGPTYREHTCYAESHDGIVWTKPKLGLCEYNGSKENNIVWIGSGTHNFTPFLDTNPTAKPEDRYKALAGGPLIALSSPDGLHWKKMQEDPVITKGAFDSQNVAFWDPARGRYAAYFRGFRDGVRAIMYATSQDFLKWTDSEWVDLGDSKKEHLYTNATTPYFRAPEILMSFPMRYVEGRQWDPKHVAPGLCDAVFMTSRDGVHFDRTFMEAFVRPGLDPENWTERNLWTAYGVVPTSPTEVSLYYGEHFRHATLRLRRATLRPDGFVSVHAGYAGGEILTRPMRFSGKELIINFSTSAAGSVRIELQDEGGQSLPGYTMQDCPPLYGDELERVIRWKGGSDLSAVAGKPLRLRVRLKDADLYSFRFRKVD
ncbi:MAG: hypothetical protein HY318_01650 [Armatimonadetes bacterium]|nr:hypothetical protein [Armatimonadota bacterium]